MMMMIMVLISSVWASLSKHSFCCMCAGLVVSESCTSCEYTTRSVWMDSRCVLLHVCDRQTYRWSWLSTFFFFNFIKRCVSLPLATLAQKELETKGLYTKSGNKCVVFVFENLYVFVTVLIACVLIVAVSICTNAIPQTDCNIEYFYAAIYISLPHVWYSRSKQQQPPQQQYIKHTPTTRRSVGIKTDIMTLDTYVHVYIMHVYIEIIILNTCAFAYTHTKSPINITYQLYNKCRRGKCACPVHTNTPIILCVRAVIGIGRYQCAMCLRTHYLCLCE